MQTPGGGSTNSQDFQKILQMQQQLQMGQMQPGSQPPLLGSAGSNLNAVTQGLPQMQQPFGNQQWGLDPSHQQQTISGGQQASQRNSRTSLNNPMGMMIQQQGQASQAVMASGNAQNAIYWNALQGNSGNSSVDVSGSNSNANPLAAIAGMGGGNLMMDSNSMQALLQQQTGPMGLGNAQQQLRSLNPQQLGNQDLSSMGGIGAAGSSLMNPQLSSMSQLGRSTSILGSNGQLQNAGAQGAILLQQHHIDNLTRLAQQGGGNGDRHAGSNAMLNQQQAQLLQMQRTAPNSVLQHMSPTLMLEQSQNNRSGLQQRDTSSANMQSSQQQKSSMNNAEPISLALLNSQNSMASGLSQLGHRGNDNTSSGTSNSLMGIFDGTGSAGNSNQAFLKAQQARLQQFARNSGGATDPLNLSSSSRSGSINEQMLAQLQALNPASGQMGQNELQAAQETLISQPGQFSLKDSDRTTDGTGGDGNSQNKSMTDLSSGSKSKQRRGSKKDGVDAGGNGSTTDPSNDGAPQQQSYLGGTFAGGWQSNEDLPSRRSIIYCICKIIEQMRPDAGKFSAKLPIMAKRLEEHLYRKAHTKEEYVDQTTLKTRLQMIAHDLGSHRSNSGSKQCVDNQETKSAEGTMGKSSGTDFHGGDVGPSRELMQLKLQQMHMEHQQQLQKGGSGNAPQNNDTTAQLMHRRLLKRPDATGLSQQPSSGNSVSEEGAVMSKNKKDQDQKKRIIRQQQQRLLLLRHASKCKAGSCDVKFCSQMVQLWKHMKQCRDRACDTAHCVSSKAVLNHYKLCKSENKTASCEVCGPVMKQIQQQSAGSTSERGDISQRSNESEGVGQSALLRRQESGPSIPLQVSSDSISLQRQSSSVSLQGSSDSMTRTRQDLVNHLHAQVLEQQRNANLQRQQGQPQPQQDLQKRQDLMQQISQHMLVPHSQQCVVGTIQAGLACLPSETDASKVEQSKSGKRRTVARRTSKTKTHDPSDHQTIRGRGVGKGKSFSTLRESAGAGMYSDVQESSAGAKRSADALHGDEVSSLEPPSKISRSGDASSTDVNPSESGIEPNEPDPVMSGSSQGHVLEQGDADQTASLVPSMSPEGIERHLESLNEGLHPTSRTITQKCLPVIRALLADQYGWVFRDAVDPKVLNLPDYFDIVKDPMHLALVEKKLEEGSYKDLETFERDTKLVFENAILYNGEESEVGEMARSLLLKFDEEYNKVKDGIKADRASLLKTGDACSLCGSQRRLFEPTALYCRGVCGMQKIRRNAVYFTDFMKSNHWCSQCYGLLQDEHPILLDDGSRIRKRDLIQAKNDAQPEEAWVQCDSCHSWVHQICALFNGRKSKVTSSYTCPKCHLNAVRKGRTVKPDVVMKTASELPHCKMSAAIEKGLFSALEKAYIQHAAELGVPVENVEKAEGLTVRVISNMEKKHVVREEMLQRYAKVGCPEEFPVRSKCVSLFQNIHGADVMLFGMYVFEYNHLCPAPNRQRVYISYLDSVNYFEPKAFRTFSYQAILIEYLRYVKKRGFHTAHIWSCPPSHGDEYIFFCHPPSQKIPKDKMLCQWYLDMLKKAKAEGVVLETRTLFDEYFKNNGSNSVAGRANDPTCLPYFEGDYIPGELENIIKDVKADEEAKRKGRENVAPAQSPSNRTGNKLGTRSNPGELVNLSQDKVMLRLGLAVGNMKQNFFVLQLRSKEYAAAVERGEDVSSWVDDSGNFGRKRDAIGGKVPGLLYPSEKSDTRVPVPVAKDALTTRDSEISTSRGDGDGAVGTSSTFEGDESCAENGRSRLPDSAGTGAPRGFNEIGQALSRFAATIHRTGITFGTTEDEDGPQELELFESRQQFLNYCQTNHFQFDELRRAKHTTMMILYQLHNPTAPKFIQQCGSCYRDISKGVCFHCATCSNFDLCEDCHATLLRSNRGQKITRVIHDPAHTFNRIHAENLDIGKNQEARNRKMNSSLQLISHASECSGPPRCASNNCKRMKELFEHLKSCEITPKKSCTKCSRLFGLLTVHSRKCTISGTCLLPFCDRIREKNRRSQQQQQLMDDRRRQAQNQLYRGSAEKGTHE